MPNFTRLAMAAYSGNKVALINYLNQGDDINDLASGFSALWIATHQGHYDICLELINRCANIDLVGLENSTPLWIASGNGHAAMVKLFIKHGANPNTVSKGNSPLWGGGSRGLYRNCN